MALLVKSGVTAKTIIEPTCGLGGILTAALDSYPVLEQAFGIEVSSKCTVSLNEILQNHPANARTTIVNEDFFTLSWNSLLSNVNDPVLVVGNPPWVTNSDLGVAGSANLPKKHNFQNRSGLDAMTGKSNFDISESMLCTIMDRLNGRSGCMAMLCKTAVARKLITHAWKNKLNVSGCAMYNIDACKHFAANVSACLFVCHFTPQWHKYDCSIYASLDSSAAHDTIGYRDNVLIAQMKSYDTWKHLRGHSQYKWRSGVKHDCSLVMELTLNGNGYRNGLDERVDIENTYLFPMLKTSQVANYKVDAPRRFMLVTQRSIGEDTSAIERIAPRTWEYLKRHADLLDKRGSSIYNKRPQFSIFGVGEYSF